MKKYHYTDGINTFGPFTLEELKTKGITADSYVWFEGMSNWAPAHQLPELQAYFGSNEGAPYYQAPMPSGVPFQNRTTGNPAIQGRPPKNYLLESIIVTILCCLPAGIVAIVYASSVETKFYAGDLRAAQEASEKAKLWTWISAGMSVFLYIGAIAIFGLQFFLGFLN